MRLKASIRLQGPARQEETERNPWARLIPHELAGSGTMSSKWVPTETLATLHTEQCGSALQFADSASHISRSL